MNQFAFPHLPFAMQQKTGVNAFLGPQGQVLGQQIQANPFMQTQGTSVPQNSWQGNQFTMPAMPKPTITTPGIPAAPPAPSAMTGPNAPVWTQGMFTPIGAKKTGYRQPDVPVPPGFRWDGSLGYFAPRDYTDEGE